MKLLRSTKFWLFAAVAYTVLSLYVLCQRPSWTPPQLPIADRPRGPDIVLDRSVGKPVASAGGKLLTFAVPVEKGLLGRADALAFGLTASRPVRDCTVQVIVECDHHRSFGHDYRGVSFGGGERRFRAPLRGTPGYWLPDGHDGAWTAWNTAAMRLVAIKVFAKAPLPASFSMSFAWERVDDDRRVDLAWARPLADPIELGERFELAFDLTGWRGNPYDPDDVSISMQVTPPGGGAVAVRAFLYQNFDALMGQDGEEIVPKGPKHWRARYRPLKEGVHDYRVAVSMAGAPAQELTGGRFTVGPGQAPDFIRISKRSPRWFEHADGRFLYPVGWGIAYAVDRPYHVEYTPYLPREDSLWSMRKLLDDLADSGGNILRLWLADWSTGIEWNEDVDNYGGLGRYNLKNAWVVDQILGQCERRGIYVILETLNHVRLSGGYGLAENPYFARNGGPMERPGEFWRSPEVIAPNRKRLRYLLARYSDSPAVHSWQYMSEIDQAMGDEDDQPSNWPNVRRRVLEYLDFIKRTDPYGHIVANHVCHPNRDFSFYDARAVEFIHTNAYPTFCGLSDDQIIAMRQVCDWFAARPKPVIFGEYAGNWQGDPPFKMERDTLGGLWSGVASQLSGTPLSWWWNFNYGEDLGYLYRNVADFMADEDLIAEDTEENGHWLHRDVEVAGPDGDPRGLMVGNRRRRFLFLFNYDTLCRTRLIPTECSRAEVRFSDMADGDFVAEYWDLRAGKTNLRERIAVRGGEGVLHPPAFKEGWAVKIYPSEGAITRKQAATGGPREAVPAPTPSGADVGRWRWRITPSLPIVNEVAAARTVYEAFIGLPRSCFGARPRLAGGGVGVAFNWEFLGEGAGWHIRIPAQARGPFELTCASAAEEPGTGVEGFDETAIGLELTVLENYRSAFAATGLFEDAFRDAEQAETMRVSAVDQLENPAGANDYFVARYRGPLIVPRDGAYTIAINSDDGSFLKLDGEVFLKWLGHHYPDAGYKPLRTTWSHRRTVTLKKGVHWIEFYHQNLTGYRLARLGWRPPEPTGERDEYDAFFQDFTPGPEGWHVVSPQFLHGRVPCSATLVREGTELATVLPCAGLALRRPRRGVFVTRVKPPGSGKGRDLFTGSAGWRDLSQECSIEGPLPVWVHNAHMRPFSLDWLCAAALDGRQALWSVCYDIDLPVALTVGGRALGERRHEPKKQVMWGLRADEAGRPFTLSLGGTPLVSGTAGDRPSETERPPARLGVRRTRQLFEATSTGTHPVPARACREWYRGKVEGARIVPRRIGFDVWTQSARLLPSLIPEAERDGAGVLLVLDRGAMFKGLSPRDVRVRTHAQARALAECGVATVMALGGELDLTHPLDRRYAEEFVRLADSLECPILDLRMAQQ